FGPGGPVARGMMGTHGIRRRGRELIERIGQCRAPAAPHGVRAMLGALRVVNAIEVGAPGQRQHREQSRHTPHRRVLPNRRSYRPRYSCVASAMASASLRWLALFVMNRASSALVPNPISTSTAGMYAVTSTRKPACFTP